MTKGKLGIIGMPFYSARLENDLRDYDSGLTVKAFDTYTLWYGKASYALHVKGLDLVFSINGDNRKSRAFTWAMKNKVPLVMNWSGTDVLTCKENFKRGDWDRALVDYARHTCQCSWIQEELKEIGIHAQIIQFQYFKVKENLQVPQTLMVLCRISQDRPDFYGMKELIALAQAHPEIKFTVVGADSYRKALPSNIEMKGWVQDMDACLREHLICLRFPLHDGLSPFILESLSYGRHCLYRFAFKGCIHIPDTDVLFKEFLKLKERFQAGSLGLNQEGTDLISTDFEQKNVYEKLLIFLFERQ